MNITITHTRLQSAALTLLCLLGASAAFGLDTYDPATRQLTLPSLQIGQAVYSGVVVTIGHIVSGPTGTAPAAGTDSYDPGNGHLTVQSVAVGAARYTNVVVTVAGLVSIGSVTGADTFDGSDLHVALVQAGDTVYQNVDADESLGDVVSVAGGMPTAGPDTYDRLTNQLAIPAVQVGNRVYTNVVVKVGGLKSVGGTSFRNAAFQLHSFAHYDVPQGNLVQDAEGNLYGTMEYGGAYGAGSVYEITGAGTLSVLYSFAGGETDAGIPVQGLLRGRDGNFYGVTLSGGTANAGTVYRITPAGVRTILYAFQGGKSDGSNPYCALTQGNDGNLYGTTRGGGAAGNGTVFRVTPSGAETLLYSFAGGAADGSTPSGGIAQAPDGNFYGTTLSGGANNVGTAFRITPAGAETTLYSFSDQVDGYNPSPLLVGSDGNLYGTTGYGGTGGSGTLFRITTSGVETVLYTFASAGIGSFEPVGTLLQDATGNLYGTLITYPGAVTSGAVFRLTPAGVVTILHSFQGGATDGGQPSGSLLLGGDGNLYGATTEGGVANTGVVFRLTPAGDETVLASFAAPPLDGASPSGSLIIGNDGGLIGTTSNGGTSGNGTVFRVTPSGTETLLYSFGTAAGDGGSPMGPLVQGSDGSLYGLTTRGGSYGVGNFFRISPAGVETVLYSFQGGTADGATPAPGFILASDGNFYGTTVRGGTFGAGTVFRITPAGVETVVYSFKGGNNDGMTPCGGLIQATDGNFYGATNGGGTYLVGSVYRLTSTGVESVLYSFMPYATDAQAPASGLIQASDGNLYGTTPGTIYRITMAGGETVLKVFPGGFADGSTSAGSLIEGRDGNFYGTTTSGGAGGFGTVYKITPDGVASVLHSFAGTNALVQDGAVPSSALVQGADGSFYGTTTEAGAGFGNGTVFRVTSYPSP